LPITCGREYKLGLQMCFGLKIYKIFEISYIPPPNCGPNIPNYYVEIVGILPVGHMHTYIQQNDKLSHLVSLAGIGNYSPCLLEDGRRSETFFMSLVGKSFACTQNMVL
jgi:hypothetical protein